MPVRQVQAHEAPWRGVREVRHRSDPGESSPRAHGAHRTGQPDRAHLVPEVTAVPHRAHAGHDAARHRAHPVFRSLRGDRSGLTPLERGQMLNEDQYLAAVEEHGDEFDARMGAEAVYELLKSLDLNGEMVRLKEEIAATNS